MTTHILISTGSDIRARLAAAFPGCNAYAVVLDAVSLSVPGSIAWLHLPADRAEAARLVSLASRTLSQSRIVALSDTPSDAQALDLMERGAVGYCHSHAGPPVLHQVATVVANQGLWVGQELLMRLVRATLGTTNDQEVAFQRIDSLSDREQEVANLVGRGSSNKEIARRLDISERTVKAHLSAIFLKLGVRDRLQLGLLLRNSGKTPSSH